MSTRCSLPSHLEGPSSVTRTSANGGDEQSLTGIAWLRDMLRRLYHGRTPTAVPLPDGGHRHRPRHHRLLHRDAGAVGDAQLPLDRLFGGGACRARYRSRGCSPRRTCSGCCASRPPGSTSSSWRRCFSRRRSPISASCASSGSGRWRDSRALLTPLEERGLRQMARADRRGRQPAYLPLHRHRLRLHLLLHRRRRHRRLCRRALFHRRDHHHHRFRRHHAAWHRRQADFDRDHDRRHLALREAGAGGVPAEQGVSRMPALRAAAARARCRALQGLRPSAEDTGRRDVTRSPCVHSDAQRTI